MWLREISRILACGLYLALCCSYQNSAQAQFRDLASAADADSQIEIHLSPTNQPFVAPRSPSPVQMTPTSAVQPAIAAVEGEPTPAVPIEAALKPSPMVVVELKAEAKNEPQLAVADESPTTESVEPSTELRENPFVAFQQGTTRTVASTAPAPQSQVEAGLIVFNQITPGVTTVEQLESTWGEPLKVVNEGEEQRHIYRAPGFTQVDALVIDGKVDSLLVHLTDPVTVEALHEPLNLMGVGPVSIDDGTGNSLGVGYPERGVLLSYAVDDDHLLVSHVLLEPVRGELYRLRAESNRRRDYTVCLVDLEHAVRLNPQDARAYWLQAELLSWGGRDQDALDCVRIATRIDSGNSLYRLTKARLQAGNGDTKKAIDAVRKIANDIDTPSLVQARAEYLLGNILAYGPEPSFHTALNHHMKAVEIAQKHSRDEHCVQRRAAKDILVDSHLAIAQDIALGHFQRQTEVVPKWLVRATELAEDYITEDEGDPAIRMAVYRTTLAVYSVLDGNFDASVATEEAINESKRLIAEADDRMYQLHIERELSEALHYAAKVEHRSGRMDVALRYANNAVVLLESSDGATQPSLFDRVMYGQLYFLTGSLYAISELDHDEAAKFYTKALPLFNDEGLVNLIDASGFGDIFVSMGVSFWQTGDRRKAIELTQSGAELLQQGVQAGTIDRIALSVPYGNLAAMHGEVGNKTQANRFAAMMGKVENDGSVRR